MNWFITVIKVLTCYLLVCYSFWFCLCTVRFPLLLPFTHLLSLRSTLHDRHIAINWARCLPAYSASDWFFSYLCALIGKLGFDWLIKLVCFLFKFIFLCGGNGGSPHATCTYVEFSEYVSWKCADHNFGWWWVCYYMFLDFLFATGLSHFLAPSEIKLPGQEGMCFFRFYQPLEAPPFLLFFFSLSFGTIQSHSPGD